MNSLCVRNYSSNGTGSHTSRLEMFSITAVSVTNLGGGVKKIINMQKFLKLHTKQS